MNTSTSEDLIMERHFILPLGVAAAFHAGLFFGFPKHAAPTSVAELTRTIITPFFLPSRDKEVVEPENVSSESPAKASFEPPNPISPEPLPTITGDWTMPHREVIATLADSTRVSPTMLGDVTGVIDGTVINAGDIISSGLLDRAPEARAQSAPIYPHEARHDGRSGTVNVEFTVDESGRVIDPRVVSSTDRIFEDATLRAVAKWRFAPGKRDMQVVRFRMAVPVVFNLDDGR
jgi:periplasmic protein TonB